MGEYSKSWEERVNLLLGDVEPAVGPEVRFEAMVGHSVLSGEITAVDGYEALGRYEAWLALGQPKIVGGDYAFEQAV